MDCFIKKVFGEIFNFYRLFYFFTDTIKCVLDCSFFLYVIRLRKFMVSHLSLTFWILKDEWCKIVEGFQILLTWDRSIYYPFFCSHLFFCNHFEDLQTVLTEVKLIINNAPLTYQNTIKICLTLNHLLLFILTQDQL